MTTPVRAAISTRSRGLNLLFEVLCGIVVLSLVLDATGLRPAGAAVAGLAGLWCAWVAYTNFAIGCPRCLRAWLVLIPGLGLGEWWAVSVHDHALLWIVAVTFSVCMFVPRYKAALAAPSAAGGRPNS